MPGKYQFICNLCYFFAICAVRRRKPAHGRPRTYRRLLNALGVMRCQSRKARANTSGRRKPTRSAMPFRGENRLARNRSRASCIRILKIIRPGFDSVPARNKRENPERERPTCLATSATVNEQRCRFASMKRRASLILGSGVRIASSSRAGMAAGDSTNYSSRSENRFFHAYGARPEFPRGAQERSVASRATVPWVIDTMELARIQIKSCTYPQIGNASMQTPASSN